MKKLTALMLLLACSSAWAIPVTWTINGAFADQPSVSIGSTVSGSFTYDADTNTYSNVSIHTLSTDSPIWGDLYTDTLVTDALYGAKPDGFNPVLSASASGLTINSGAFMSNPCFGFCQSTLFLVFASSLTNAGGTVSLVPGLSKEDLQDAFDVNYVVASRFIETGSLVGVAAVPVPAAVWLFGSALAGLGWMSRKRVV